MLFTLLNERSFQEMMNRHISDTLLYLLENDQPFGLLCNLKYVTFDPPLPEEIYNNLNDITLFMIAGYTFESFTIEDDFLFFEAGFGTQNFGSLVSMPLLAILQLLVEETPIFINMAQPITNFELEDDEKDTGIKNSLENFLNNPENKKFLKK